MHRPPRLGQQRAVLRARVEARRDELEREVLDRIAAISDPSELADPSYADGLHATVWVAIDRGEEHAPPAPVVLLAQARAAARNGVSLDTVSRRYFAAVSKAYELESEMARAQTSRQRLADRIDGILSGELLDTSDLDTRSRPITSAWSRPAWTIPSCCEAWPDRLAATSWSSVAPSTWPGRGSAHGAASSPTSWTRMPLACPTER